MSQKLLQRFVAWLHSLRDLFATAWWIILIVGVGFYVAFQYVEPAPSRTLVFSAGAEGGAYHQFAQRYAEILKREGITVEVRTSAGSLENLQRLNAEEADVAFVQGGGVEQQERVHTLGSVFYEPVWVFYRSGERDVEQLFELKGKRIAIGGEGSGVRQLALKLLEANEMAVDRKGQLAPGLLPLGGQAAADALLQGKVDAAFLIAAPESRVVQQLLQTGGINMINFAEAPAYRKRLNYLLELTLPRSSIDLVRQIPVRNVKLLAVTAHLAVREDLHPALKSLLLQAASEIHGGAGFFQNHREFPAYKDQSLALSPEAQRYYKSGPPFLQRYLPFWLAVLVDRTVVLLVPVFALLFPLLKVAPSVYTWRVRSRVFRLYGELKVLEIDVRADEGRVRTAEFVKRLDDIEAEANGLSIPLGFADLLYNLRIHLQLVRNQLLARGSAAL